MDAVKLQSQGLPEQAASWQPPLPELLVVRPDRVEEGRSAGMAPDPTDLSARMRTFYLEQLHPVSFTGLSVFVLAILALHGLQANLNPAEHTISEYSLGRYGWLMRAAFLALAVGTLATAASLWLHYEPSRWRRVGLLLLVVMAIGLFLDAGFNTDQFRVPETFDGTIHGVGTWMQALALPGAAFVFGSDFVRHSISTPKAKLLVILGAAQLGSILLFEMSPATTRGWAERLVTVLAVATLGLLQVLSRTRPPAGEPRAAAHSSSGSPVFGLSPVSTSD